MDRVLTFAGLYALEPRVAKLIVIEISAFVEPRTATKAATELAGFRVHTALGARRKFCNIISNNAHAAQ